MAESKATQCPVCKKGKRYQDPYCSTSCALEALRGPGDPDAVAVVFCPSIDGSSEADPLDMAAQAEEMRDRLDALPTLTFGACPTCGGQAQVTCRCRRSDSRCSNGHWWHHDGEFIHAGESDHGSMVCCRGEPIAKWRKST